MLMSDLKTKTLQVPPEIHEQLSEIQLWLIKQLRLNRNLVRNVTYPEVITYLLLLNEEFQKVMAENPKELTRILEKFTDVVEKK